MQLKHCKIRFKTPPKNAKLFHVCHYTGNMKQKHEIIVQIRVHLTQEAIAIYKKYINKGSYFGGKLSTYTGDVR